MKIVFSGEIDQKSVKEPIEKILNATEPIDIYINSGGGESYSSLAIVDVILNCRYDVNTYAIGETASSALTLFISGKNRYIGKNARLMYHDLSKEYDDYISVIKTHLKEIDKTQAMIDNLLVSRSKLTEKRLKGVRNRKENWYIYDEEAVELGIAHKIMGW